MFALNDDIASRATACAAEVCWRQWQSLAAAGVPIDTPRVASIIDPEALVLLSLLVRRHERRLDDQLLWWASAGSSLMSVQRMRTLLADYPERVRGELAAFAAMAVDSGDPRWSVLAGTTKKARIGRPGKGPRELQLLESSTVMLRLRAGLGVGAKADVLAFLLGVATAWGERAAWATAEVISKATSYSVASIRRAATEMALARLVSVSAERPAQYAVDVPAWAELLQLRAPGRQRSGNRMNTKPDMPAWRFWAQMFAFLAALGDLNEDAALSKAASVVQASRLRDVAERFRRPLAWNGIDWIDPRKFPGERYLDASKETIDVVVAWISEHA